MTELDKYDFELDPPTMMEFQLFFRLGNVLDMIDHAEQWPDEAAETELKEVARLLDQAGAKYDGMLMEYYEGQTRRNIDDRQSDL